MLFDPVGETGILVEQASWWNGHLSRSIPRRAISTVGTQKIRTPPWVVRYGAGCSHTGARC
ncbi:hypothetical protein [Moorena producens]|uniref:hypothetical protein n=1 Tax=Moorena producens TaxID=1155739 RepID=UPI003C73B860